MLYMYIVVHNVINITKTNIPKAYHFQTICGIPSVPKWFTSILDIYHVAVKLNQSCPVKLRTIVASRVL